MKVVASSDLLREQRLRAAPVNRVLALLGAGTFALFALTNPYYITPELAIQYAYFAVPSIFVLLGYVFFTTRDAFASARWAEFFVFSILTPLDAGIIWTLSEASHQIGWQPHAILFCNVATLLPFAILVYVANFRAFAIWIAASFIAYLVAILNMEISVTTASFNISSVITLSVFGLYANWSLNQRAYESLRLRQDLNIEKLKSEEMLYSILPEEVAARLRAGQAVADPFSDACVVFFDIVGSSELARTLSPKHFVRTLDKVFTIADQSVLLFNIEKVKTVGDAYLAIAGGRTGGDALSAVLFSIDIVRKIQELAVDDGLDLSVRVGIHSGPVVGGVIGSTKASYDYWGDTMNIAARVEGSSPVGGISVTKQVYYATRHEISYSAPRLATLKGIGEIPIYDVLELQA